MHALAVTGCTVAAWCPLPSHLPKHSRTRPSHSRKLMGGGGLRGSIRTCKAAADRLASMVVMRYLRNMSWKQECAQQGRVAANSANLPQQPQLPQDVSFVAQLAVLMAGPAALSSSHPPPTHHAAVHLGRRPEVVLADLEQVVHPAAAAAAGAGVAADSNHPGLTLAVVRPAWGGKPPLLAPPPPYPHPTHAIGKQPTPSGLTATAAVC